ncbi:MAG: ABC transporter permease, partial [Gammaproteobacteria bacterium]|nr:ABC transporter permease [Gammaproteobacteria bacterium]
MDNWRKNPLVFWILSLPPSLWLSGFFLVPLALIWAYSFGHKEGIIDIVISWTPDNYLRALDPLYLQ